MTKKYKKLEDFFSKENELSVVDDECIINNISDFYLLLDFLNRDKKRYIFRGQSNTNLDNDRRVGKFKEWVVNSTLMRSFEQNSEQNYFFDFLKSATKGLLKKIRERPEFLKKSNIELLSEMQHQGIPSMLIDFTSEIFSSLFFAFNNDNFSTENDKNNSIGFASIYFKELKDEEPINDIDFEKENDSCIVYICPKNINRGISQKSYFILDNNSNYNDDYSKIKISYKLKKEIIYFLKKENVSNESIFPDVYGIYKEHFKEDTDILLIDSISLFNLGRFKEAISKCEDLIKINPNHANAYFYWGFILDKKGHYDEAIEKYKKAIKINPNYASAYSNCGATLDKNGRYDEAIEKYKKAIKINPNHANAYSNWGATLDKNGHYDEAIEKYKKAIKINPNHAIAYSNWGLALKKNGYYDEAIEKYKKAIKINPNYASAYSNWGVALGKNGHYDEAIEKFKKAIEINPKNKEYKNFLKELKNWL